MNEQLLLPYLAIGISVIGTVVGYLNHKRLRSTCCGAERTISVDIESTTPPDRYLPKRESRSESKMDSV